MQRQLRCEDYTVGWVCALPVELAAAQLMLDELHLGLKRDSIDTHDALYVLGSINGHNVAIGCLPAGQTGNNSAAVVATQMLATFKKIRFGLMVGIGGGVPSASADVRLGDVVVSQPDATFGGVVQYDMGKTTIDGFRRTGSLNAPPQSLLNAVSRIRANEWLGTSGLSKNALRLEGSKFQRSRAGLDVLYDAAYNHEGPQSQTCVRCSADKIRIREPRIAGEEVLVHYGTIASGNRVMKNASERDKASAQLGDVLCFEMEAAGLMNTFPCLVIRGICDYSDTHKNDRWHAYAAGIAAAYGREVLSVIEPTEVTTTQTTDRDIEQHSDTLPVGRDHERCPVEDETRHHALSTNPVADAEVPHFNEAQSRQTSQQPDRGPALSDEQRKTIRASLNFKQRDARLLTLKKAQAKTCQWLLKNTKYLDWMHADKLTQHRGFFWIKGKPGSGKSIMMKFLFSHAKKTLKKKTLVLSFFFNARGDTLEKTTSGLYRALVLQLLEKAPQTWKAFDDDSETDATLNLVETSGWQDEILCQLFIRCLQELGDCRVVCFVDALDECPEDEIRAMVSFFEEIGEIESTAECRVCFSSRHYPEISIRTGLELVLEAEAEHTNDITAYIDANLKMGDDPQYEDVRAEIVRKASGIFLWVHLVIPLLNKEYDTGRSKALKKRLADIPPGLHDLFVDMLTRDQRRLRVFRVSVEIILYAARPLKPEEFRIAVEAYCEGSYDPRLHKGIAMMSPESLRKFVLDSSKGLAEITKSTEATVQWIHESVRDFFLREDGLSKLQSAEKSINESGHAIFVTICLQQLNSFMGARNSDIAQLNLEEVPILRYAVDHILIHANEFQKADTYRNLFLQKFCDHYESAWYILYSFFHPTISADTHLLYHLCEIGADELVRNHPDRNRHLEIRGGTYGFPLIAALYAGHNAAARALLGLPSTRKPTQQTSNKIAPLRKANFSKKRHILAYLCEYGDLDILKCALSTDSCDGNRLVPHELFEYAASEAVVDLLVSFLDDTQRLTTRQRNISLSTDLQRDPCISTDMPYLRSYLEEFPRLVGKAMLWGSAFSLLEYAASKGFDKTTSLCIELQGLQYRSRALEAAICGCENSGGRVLVVERLLQPEYATIGEGDTLGKLLFHAIRCANNENVIRLVLTKSKVNLESRGPKGMTPLLWALSLGRKTYVKMLLQHGSDTAPRMSGDGTTPLILAIKLSDLSSFRLLLDYAHCSPNARDKYGRTALMWCAMVADDCANKMILELRKQADLRPNSQDMSGRTALMRAVESANPAIVQALLSIPGIKSDHGPCQRSTPLRLSLMRYIETRHTVFLAILVELLDRGKASLHCNKKLPTPLKLIANHDEIMTAGLQSYWRARQNYAEEGAFKRKMAQADNQVFLNTS